MCVCSPHQIGMWLFRTTVNQEVSARERTERSVAAAGSGKAHSRRAVQHNRPGEGRQAPSAAKCWRHSTPDYLTGRLLGGRSCRRWILIEQLAQLVQSAVQWCGKGAGGCCRHDERRGQSVVREWEAVCGGKTRKNTFCLGQPGLTWSCDHF